MQEETAYGIARCRYSYHDDGRPTWLVTCPLCGFDYTHHGRVVVFEREGHREDAQSYKLFPGLSIAAPTNDNPSVRRGAVRIYFSGECGHRWWLDIIQHKGQTYLVPVPLHTVPEAIAPPLDLEDVPCPEEPEEMS